jgi:hypothetical protein
MDSWAIGEADRYEVLNGDRAIEPCLVLPCLMGRDGVDIVSQSQLSSDVIQLLPLLPHNLLSDPGIGEMMINIYNWQRRISSSMSLPLQEDIVRRERGMDLERQGFASPPVIPVIKLVQPPSNLANR